jgi:hypothetical protein
MRPALEKVEAQLRRQTALLTLARLDKSHLTGALREITEIDARTWASSASASGGSPATARGSAAPTSPALEGGPRGRLELRAADCPSYFRALEDW